MASIDLLLEGVPGRTDQGYLGQSSVTLIDGSTVVDTGGLARRPMLRDALEATGTDPREIDDVLLSHVHFDHVQNVDLFENATVHVPADEIERVETGGHDWATPPFADRMLDALDVAQMTGGEVLPGVEAVHSPGHVEHHYSFVLERDSLTIGITGDAIKNVREFVTGDPFTLWDDAVAAETQRRLAERLDFVVPGHDAPFYVEEDGSVTPCDDVALTVRLQMSGESETRVTTESSREEVAPYPESVAPVAVHQSF
ncbi:MAG: MBL fold metallo-hydrolase [Halanaeroarchaeum sp.]